MCPLVNLASEPLPPFSRYVMEPSLRSETNTVVFVAATDGDDWPSCARSRTGACPCLLGAKSSNPLWRHKLRGQCCSVGDVGADLG